jgi:IclR family transcriptional regulator, pca regulon regulatory protein
MGAAAEKEPGARTIARKLEEDDREFISALARGLAVLGLFTPEAPKLTFSEICSRSNLPRSSVNRLLGTLLGLEYLAFDEETRRYMCGPRSMSLGLSALSAMDIRELVRPYLVTLFRTLDETISYGVRDGMEVVIAERISTRRVIAVELSVGARLPLHSTSMGRCLVSFLPHAEREALIEELSVRQSSSSILMLRNAILFAHRNAYAISNEEFAPGLVSVAMPVWDQNERIRAAANVALPAFRVSAETLVGRVVPALAQTGRKISLSLGASEKWIDGGWRNHRDFLAEPDR